MGFKRSAPYVMKINLGSGPASAPAWVNFDWGALPLLSKFPRFRKWLVRRGHLPSHYELEWPPIRLVDLRRRPWPLKDASVDFFFCSQVLEHFERWEARDILREAHRALRKGGVIRVAVPDARLICRVYLEEEAKGVPRAGRELSHRIWGHPKDEEPLGWVARFRRRFIRGHQWLYDEAEMRRLMDEAGFTEIRRCRFREGEVPDLDRLDLECHAPFSLYMEAVAGRGPLPKIEPRGGASSLEPSHPSRA